MRFFVGKRIHLPVVGGVYVGASFGSFHFGEVFQICFWTGLLLMPWLASHIARWLR
jgi:hypothetical protein